MALPQGTLYFMAIDLLSTDEVVHELRHDLESFFWVLVWIVLRHTTHSLGKKACNNLFNGENEEQCKGQKVGFLGGNPKPLVVAFNEPLTNLIKEFRLACRNNNTLDSDRPSDPLTHRKVLKIFDDALAQEGWPTEKDHARSFRIPDDEKELRQRGTWKESNIDSNRIGSGTAHSNPPSGQGGNGKALLSGSRPARRLANAAGSGSGAQVASGSRSRKRSREAREKTDVADEADSDDERTKRTKTNSERHAAEASGGRKQPKARRGRK